MKKNENPSPQQIRHREYMREYYRVHKSYGPKPESRNCERCGKEFQIASYRKKRFCSARCGAIKGGYEAVCLRCPNKIWVVPSNKGTHRFCSVSCSMIGTNHAGDGSKSNERERWQGSKALKDWRFAVFSRDGFKCVMCGDSRNKLNADHIKPWAYFPELRSDINNGRTLCVPCHKQTPTFGSKAKILATQGAL